MLYSPVSRSLLITAFHFLVDAGVVLLGMAIGTFWRFEQWTTPQFLRYLPAVLIASLVLPSVIYTGGMYSPSHARIDSWSRTRWTLFGLSAALIVLLGMGSIDLNARVGRGVLLAGFPLVTLLCIAHQILLHRSQKQVVLRAVCLVSEPDDELAASILSKNSASTSILGVLPVGGYEPVGTLPHLGNSSPLLETTLPANTTMVMVRESHLMMPDLTPALRRWRYQGIDIVSLTDICEMVFHAVPLQLVTENWLFRASSQSGLLYIKKLKRLFDICVSLLCLLTLWPALLLGIIAVRLGSSGPIFFRQTRLGRMGKPFVILKLRTMHMDAEKDGPQWSGSKDQRIFYLGTWLRRFRIDEIPQLLNILRGEMSFVGPRPERPEFIDDLELRIPFYRERLLVQPGLTGWAQVRYPYGASMEDAWRKHELDLYYIKHMSLLLDFFVLLETIRTVLTGGVRPKDAHTLAMHQWRALDGTFEHPLKDTSHSLLDSTLLAS